MIAIPDRFYDKLDLLSKKIEGIGERYSLFITKNVDIITNIISKSSDIVLSILISMTDWLGSYRRIMRYITMPAHWLWIYLKAWLMNQYDDNEPLNEIGQHYIQSLAGGGKSTLLWQKMHDYAEIEGRCSYVTTKLEKIKFDDFGRPYKYHYYFNPQDFFGKEHETDKVAIQLKRFDTKQACALIFDEMHYLNNSRNNRQRYYNDVFVPMISSFVTQRHFGIKWILISSQMPKNDVQIMNNLTGYHKVKIRKGFIYKKWLEDGKWHRRIKGWSIKSFTVSADNDYLKLESNRRWFKKATVDFSDFESLNMKDVLNDRPIDRREILQ